MFGRGEAAGDGGGDGGFFDEFEFGGVALFDCFVDVCPPGCECAAEGVACADGVDALDDGGGHATRAAFVGEDRAVHAQREDGGLRAKVGQAKGEARGVEVGVKAHDAGGFVFVDDQDINEFEQVGGQGSCGGCVEDDGAAAGFGDFGGGDDGGVGDFELQEQHVGHFDFGGVLLDEFGRDFGVGAGRDDDGVLAAFGDGDEGEACGGLGAGIDA